MGYFGVISRRFDCVRRAFCLRQVVLSCRSTHTCLKFNKSLLIMNLKTCTCSMSTLKKYENRLKTERSPYLKQHANNPVDWYPWCEEAFQKAKDENKLIFLSVGYSTCHWCHVMEKESFQDEEIGSILNEHFVSVKVDREERPDVDMVYMTFIQATAGQGGWPMSVWLTPDLNPIVGGTYFPPDNRYYGRPGFKTILLSIANQWENQALEIESQGLSITDALKRVTHNLPQPKEKWTPSPAVSENCFKILRKSYDSEYGGFSLEPPKFPKPVNLNFMLRYYAQNPTGEDNSEALDMVLNTLKHMANGGIHDHIAQGFHRYSTDTIWHIPHFEKMLYDQAQLLYTYAEVYNITGDKLMGEMARDIVQYVTRDLYNDHGGFYSAEDADSLPTADASVKKEGAFCVWAHSEIVDNMKELVSGSTSIKLSDVFSHYFNVFPEGNVDPFKDPHDELKEKNVLIVKKDIQETADHFGLSKDVTQSAIDQGKKILFKIRQHRPRPHHDDKFIAAWNGLMISGLAKAAVAFHDQSLVDIAVKAAQFLKENMYREETGILLRTGYVDTDGSISTGSREIEGFAKDYAFVIRGLLDLYDACHDDAWVQWALELQQKQNKLFWDQKDGAYFNSQESHSDIILRLKEDQDEAEPCTNAVSVHNLLKLSSLMKEESLKENAETILGVFNERLLKVPHSVPEMVTAVYGLVKPLKQVVLCGESGEEDLKKMIQIVHSKFDPNRILIVLDGHYGSILTQRSDFLQSLKMKDAKVTAYVCQNFTCDMPTNDVSELQKLL